MIELAVTALVAALGMALGALVALFWRLRPCPRCALLDVPPRPLDAPVSFLGDLDDVTPVRRRPVPPAAYRPRSDGTPANRTTVDMRVPRLDDD